MKPRKNFWIYSLVILFAGIAAFISNEIFLQRVFLGLILLLIVCFFWALFSLKGIFVKRFPFQQTRQVGTVFREQIELINQSVFPKLWLELMDLSGFPGTKTSRIITFLPARSHKTYTSIFVLVKRGFFSLGPTRISSGDPLGLFQSTKVFKAEKKVVILPFKVQIQSFFNPPGHFSGGKAIRSASQDQTPHFSSIRDYKPGDSLARIHWRSTAKYGKLISKEFDQDPMSTVWIFLDGNIESQFSGDTELKIPEIDRHGNRTKVYDFYLPEDSYEYGVSITGSIASYYLQQGQSVGIFINDETKQFLSPERGQRQLEKIMESLALTSSKGELPIQAVVESQLQVIQNHSTVIIVSSDNSSGMVLAYESLIRRGANVMLVYLDGCSFESKIHGSSKAIFPKSIIHLTIRKNDDLRKVLNIKEAA